MRSHGARPLHAAAAALHRHARGRACAAATLRAALEAAFAANPRLRGYVLDDQGHVRPNVAIFVDGRRCARSRRAQSDPLAPDSRVYVMQALSGG